MTVSEIRNHIADRKSIECFGIEWKLLEDDLVRIVSLNDIVEVKYSDFIDLDKNISINVVENEEITDLRIKKDDKFAHTMVLWLDTRPKEKKERIEKGVNARMQYR